MKAIMVMFDSLNRHLLPPYGCDWVQAPNFERLARRSLVFDNFFVGSMPCMPARREIHTGRYNFLHRSWGPLEPFDDSMPGILSRNGVYTHLVSDHYHYWEDGGATYHNRYSSWEISRGQEGDKWKADLGTKTVPADFNPERSGAGRTFTLNDFINRKWLDSEEKMPQAVTFDLGLRFIEKNHDQDNWFLTVETFDPHEPFFSQPEYRKRYDYDFDALGLTLDWPPYRRVEAGEEEKVRHFRYAYAALVTMCDHYLGKILDAMDRHNLWDDTMLIVNTDHGFMLGEHGWLAKNTLPLYNEIANTPFFLWDPRGGRAGERCAALAQTIDLAPTLLDYFGLPIPPDMQGLALGPVSNARSRGHEAVAFGYFGRQLNVTDGRHVYMRSPVAKGRLHEYTLFPTVMRGYLPVEALSRAELHDGFGFTKNHKLLRIPTREVAPGQPHMLFDLAADPRQDRPLDNAEIENQMLEHLSSLLDANEAPRELRALYGVP